MKKLLIGLLAIFPIVTFSVGYNMGQRKIIYVQPDAPRAVVSQEKSIGTVAGVTMISPTPTPSPKETLSVDTEGTDTNSDKNKGKGEDVWNAVNNYRQAHNLTPFVYDEILCTQVHERLDKLQSAGHLHHDGFNETVNILVGMGFNKVAENLAQGFTDPAQIISSWDGSSGHQALLQSSEFNHGCSNESGGFTVLIAGKK